jgi:hypothetical protein
MREEDIPANIAPDGGGLPDEVAHAMGHPQAVRTASRNDWLHAALLFLYKELGGAALEFLVKDPALLPNIDESAFHPVPIAGSPIQFQEVWVVTKLPHADLMSASRDIDAWFRHLKLEPMRFYGLLNGEPEEASRWIDESVDLREEESRDDGDFAPYLFSFLKSLKSLLQQALELGSAVVHVRCTYLLRSVAAA